MFGLNQKIFNNINILTDAIILFISYLLSTFVRFYIMYGTHPALYRVWNSRYFFAAVAFAIFEIIVFYFDHLRDCRFIPQDFTDCNHMSCDGAKKLSSILKSELLTSKVE